MHRQVVIVTINAHVHGANVIHDRKLQHCSVDKVLAFKESTEVENLPYTETHEGEEREPCKVLHALIRRD